MKKGRGKYMKAIVYTTQTGSTKRYAQMISEGTGLPVYSFKDSKKNVPVGADIVYLGWINAGKIQGYRKASKRYKIRAACGVGMSKTGTMTENVRKRTRIAESVPLFTLQGNFNIDKLHGFYRLIMALMAKAIKNDLENKKDLSLEEADIADMVIHGGERVKSENLNDFLDWYNSEIIK